MNEIKSIILKSNPQYSFRGSSDTEVILAAIENFGFENSLKDNSRSIIKQRGQMIQLVINPIITLMD